MPTLNTGEYVPDGHPEADQEDRLRKVQVATMFSLRTREDRADYLRTVRRRDGDLAADRLRDAYKAEWDRREAARKASA